MKFHFAFFVLFAAGISGLNATAADNSVTVDEFLSQGKHVALQARDALGGKLQQAMREGGPVAAIEFCKDNAQSISDDTAKKLNASVVRVSDRPRNPSNAANPEQLAYIVAARSSLAKGEQPSPAIFEKKGHMVGYYPIVTNGMCLQCHGTPGKEITQETSNVLSAKYPHDQAVGYRSNELRGIFVVTMTKD